MTPLSIQYVTFRGGSPSLIAQLRTFVGRDERGLEKGIYLLFKRYISFGA